MNLFFSESSAESLERPTQKDQATKISEEKENSKEKEDLKGNKIDTFGGEKNSENAEKNTKLKLTKEKSKIKETSNVVDSSCKQNKLSTLISVQDSAPSNLLSENDVRSSPKNDAFHLDQNVDMESLVDELEKKDIDDIVQNRESFGANLVIGEKNSHSQLSNSKCKKSNDVLPTKCVSPRLKSLISFSKNFVLKGNVRKNASSPSSNIKISVYKGSLSTPRNKRNHVRVLDFNTPRKAFTPKRKRTLKAKTNLKFSPPSFKRKLGQKCDGTGSAKKKRQSPSKPLSLSTILEESKEDRSYTDWKNPVALSVLAANASAEPPHSSSANNSSLSRDPRLCGKKTEAKLLKVEEDLFLSEDESPRPLFIPSSEESDQNLNVTIDSKPEKRSSLCTPGKGTLPPLVCLEATTPTLYLCKGSSAPEGSTSFISELNTPIFSAISATHKTTPKVDARNLPDSHSAEDTYYQPSERTVTESTTAYSPLQEDIETELIKTAQQNEIEMARILALEAHPEEGADEGGEETVLAKSEADEKSEVKSTLFDDLLKDRPKYKLRKLTNEQLGKVVEQEMKLFSKMQALASQCEKSERDTESVTCKDSTCTSDKSSDKNNKKLRKGETRTLSGHSNKSKKSSRNDSTPKPRSSKPKRLSNKSKSLITYESFHCNLEVLKTFTLAVLRDSHIESARNVFVNLMGVFDKAKKYKSTFAEEEAVDLLLGIVNFYASPEMANKLKAKPSSSTKLNENASRAKEIKSSTNKTENILGPLTNAKTTASREGSTSKNGKRLGRPRKSSKSSSKKNSAGNIDLIECEIEAVMESKKSVTSVGNHENKKNSQNKVHRLTGPSLSVNKKNDLETSPELVLNDGTNENVPVHSDDKTKNQNVKTLKQDTKDTTGGVLTSSRTSSGPKAIKSTPTGCFDKDEAPKAIKKSRKHIRSKGCIRATEFRGTVLHAAKPLSPAEDYGCILNITARKKKKGEYFSESCVHFS